MKLVPIPQSATGASAWWRPPPWRPTAAKSLHIVSFGGSAPSTGRLLQSPFPAGDRWNVVAVPRDVFLVFDQPLVDGLFEIGGAGTELRQTVDHVLHQMEAVEIVQHDHVERGRGRALLLVAADV